MAIAAAPFATFLIVGPTCFFLGILFAQFPYDYNVIWRTVQSAADSALDPREPYYQILETHLRFLHASPPLISRILHIVMGTGLLGFMLKLYKMTESNMLFDGAGLVLYMIGVVVYITNIVKGLRIVTDGTYGAGLALDDGSDPVSREDSLKVMSASNTILAVVLVGVLILQAGEWYSTKKEAADMEELDKKVASPQSAKKAKESKKKQ